MNYHTVTKYITYLCIKVSQQNTLYISACTCQHRKLPAFRIILWILCIYCRMFCGQYDAASASEYLQGQRNTEVF